jgi:hypothetical protein
MLNKYRLFQRANGVFSWQDNDSAKQGSLHTKDRRAAEKLLHAKNEAYRLPTLNLTMARAYLSAHDAKMSTRTWMAVMREMEPTASERNRREQRSSEGGRRVAGRLSVALLLSVRDLPKTLLSLMFMVRMSQRAGADRAAVPGTGTRPADRREGLPCPQSPSHWGG